MRVGGGERGRYRVCNTEGQSMGTPGANKGHDIIAWQGVRTGGVMQERQRRKRGEYPQLPILPLGAHPLEWIRAE